MNDQPAIFTVKIVLAALVAAECITEEAAQRCHDRIGKKLVPHTLAEMVVDIREGLQE